MQKQPPSSFCARAAIAAALALGSTSVFAQDAAPAPDIPTIAPPAPAAAAPAPQVTTQSSPVVQQVPAAAEPEAATAQRAPDRSAARARPATRALARSAPAAAAPVTALPAAAGPIAAPPPAPVAPAAVEAPIAQAAPPPVADARTNDSGLTGEEAGLLALLAAAGLAGAGFLAARSRRRREVVEEQLTEYAPAVAAAPAPGPVFVRDPALERFAKPTAAPPVMARPAPAGDARQALLERMVAAEPDEANPFVSRKRRVRRARMILAQRDQQSASPAGDSFDWRTYRPAATAREDLPEPSTA